MSKTSDESLKLSKLHKKAYKILCSYYYEALKVNTDIEPYRTQFNLIVHTLDYLEGETK